MVLASGRISLISFSWSATGGKSEVPVTLPPGASSDATRSAPTGSVTPAKKIGVSGSACTIACAVGVAMATTRSLLPNAEAIEVSVAWSPAALRSS